MPPGGKRKGAGRKPSEKPPETKKKQFIIRIDQIEFLDGLPRYKGSEFVRDAIDEKRERETTDK